MELKDISKKPTEALTGYMCLLRHMSLADGILDEKEEKFLTQQSERFGVQLGPDCMEKAEVLANPIELLKQYNILVEQDMHHSFLMDLVVMAAADGSLENREREFLQRIKSQINIPSSDFHNLISFSQVTFGCDDIENIDEKSLNVLENFYRWAGQRQISLYHQTSFSSSERVDEQLKQIYQELEIDD